MPEKARMTRKNTARSRASIGRAKAPRAAAILPCAGAERGACRLSGNSSITPRQAASDSPAAISPGVTRSAVAKSLPARTPPKTGPMMNPRPNAAPIIPIPLARRSGGVTSAMYACAAAMLPAQMPAKARAANSIHSQLAKAIQA